jgi:hypothetical protein
MGTRRDRSVELRALATELFHLMRERELATTERLKITAPLSRILGHSPEYRALQRSGKTKRARLSKDPSFFTIVDDAATIDLGSPDDFMILGTITTYVGARAYSRARRAK